MPRLKDKTCRYEIESLDELKYLSKKTGISESALLRQFLRDGLDGYSDTAMLMNKISELQEQMEDLKKFSLSSLAATTLLHVERGGPGKKPMYRREDNIIYAKGALSLAEIYLNELKN